MDPPRRRYRFYNGEQVEVCSKEEGFLGSYYEATIVSYLNNGRYKVQYRNLMNEDESMPLIENVYPGELRPLPPQIHTSVFSPYQIVDAFQNDGWWVGEIRARRGSIYYVYFNSTNEEIAYPTSQIRAHHEWVNGLWIVFQ